MAKPFAASTWSKATNAPVPGGAQLAGLIQSPDSRILFAQGTGGNFIADPFTPGAEYQSGWLAVSYDTMATWFMAYNTSTSQPPGGYSQQDGMISATFTIRPPVGPRMFYRLRLKFGRSTTGTNGTLYHGRLMLDQSEDGTLWWEIQTLYSWPQINKGAEGARATITLGLGYASVPASGPNGANADWLLISIRVHSPTSGGPGDLAVNQTMLWRSDDFGFSWAPIRDLTARFDPVLPVKGLRRSPSGRWHTGQGNGMAFSDNLGVTWTDAVFNGAGFAGPWEYFQGNTMGGIQPASPGGAGYIKLSCDDGANWPAGTFFTNSGQTTIAGMKVGPVEHLVVNPRDLTVHEILYSNTGGESYETIATFSSSSLLSGETRSITRCPVTLMYCVATGTGFTARSTGQAPGSVGTRTTCLLSEAGIGQAAPLVTCGATIVPDKCEG